MKNIEAQISSIVDGELAKKLVKKTAEINNQRTVERERNREYLEDERERKREERQRRAILDSMGVQVTFEKIAKTMQEKNMLVGIYEDVYSNRRKHFEWQKDSSNWSYMQIVWATEKKSGIGEYIRVIVNETTLDITIVGENTVPIARDVWQEQPEKIEEEILSALRKPGNFMKDHERAKEWERNNSVSGLDMHN